MQYPKALSLSSIAVKAVHNSYGPTKRTISEQLTWEPERPYRGGCCGLELDLVQDTGSFRWSVQHGHDYTRAASAQLSTYLGRIHEWSAQQGGDHPPIFIHLDLKNSPGDHADFAAAFDSYVRAAMPGSQFFTPGDLLGGHATLLDAALSGWPSVAEVWGRFLCCLSGKEHARTSHYIGDPAARLCFADRDVSGAILAGPMDPRQEPNRVFYNLRYDKLAGLSRLIEPQYRAALIFRVYEVNDEDTWRLAQALGVNLIATDQIFVTRWAVASKECPLCPITVHIP